MARSLPAGFGAALKKRMRAGVPAGEAMRQTWREFKTRYVHEPERVAVQRRRHAERMTVERGNPDGRRIAGVYFCPRHQHWWTRYTDKTWAVVPKKHVKSYVAMARQLKVPHGEEHCPKAVEEGKLPPKYTGEQRNPGRRWHLDQAERDHDRMISSQSKGERMYYTGKVASHELSAKESWNLGLNPRGSKWLAGFRKKGGRILVAQSPSPSWEWVSGPYDSKAEARAAARAYQREVRRMGANPAKFCVERLKPPGLFDKRSFRTVVARKHRVTIGCPRGEWDNRAKRCRVPTVAQRILHPEGEKKCPVGGEELERRVRRNPWVVKVDPIGYLGKPKRRMFKRYKDAERYALAQPQHVGTALHYRRPTRREKEQGNPHKPVLIYDRLLELRAQKGRASRYAGESFKHPFTSGAKVYGLPDGSVLLRGKKRLWDQVRQR